MKVFAIDINRCNGCYNCQLACKDEHCDQPWPPYSAAEPLIGQFWLKMEERERGQVPVVRVSYIPTIGAQDEAIRDYAPEVLMPREDGIIVLDPEKCQGRKDLAEKFPGVYYNEELDLAQGCTGCAHLLDNGWTVPRCVDACATDALLFGDEEDFDLTGATKLTEGSHVYYFNYPKRFIAGLVFDPCRREVVIGAPVDLVSGDEVVATQLTDDFGDFRFDQIDAGAYRVVIRAEGYGEKVIEVDVSEEDRYIGDVALDQ
ncbi:MAG: oxidoreductase [Eggerthellaceae bacterium]|nr:oxidoreductase [Eggerthellaceae bacterium]